MKINLSQLHELSPKELAMVLINAEPEDFGGFWLEFSRLVKEKEENGDNTLLDKFAEYMARPLGKNRYFIFERLYKLIQFHLEKYNRPG